MNQVRKANIVLVLYNGKSGWAKEKGDIGICHAELQIALSTAPAKVRLIQIKSNETNETVEENANDKRFKDYVNQQNLFRGRTANTGEEVIERCKEALRDAVPTMVNLGVREARKGKFYNGEALDWSKLDFQNRKKAIEESLYNSLKSRERAVEKDIGVFVPIKKKSVLILCHGIPDSMGVAAAREMVGQSFIHDYRYEHLLGEKYVGPIHLIACHGRVTETQVRKLIGFPDVIIVSPPFGIYAADHIHKSQLVLITNCRDDTSTRNGVQRFFDWLEQSREDNSLIQRAEARSRIIQTIAKVRESEERSSLIQ